MALLTRKRKILAKVEAVYGTDSTPAAATDAVLLRDLNVTPLDVSYDERTLIRATLGAFEQAVGMKSVKIEATIECAGFSTLSAPTPGYDALLRACGLAQTINAGPPATVVYNPVSAAFESVTVYYERDGVLQKALGCLGTLSLELAEGKIPAWKVSLTGVDGGSADLDIGIPDTSAYLRPLAVNSANTTGFSILGFAGGILRSLSIDLGNQIEQTTYVGDAERVSLTDRQVSGKMSVQATTVAAMDWLGKIVPVQTGAFALQHGPVGNSVSLSAPAVQIISPAESDDKGVAFMDFDLRFLPSAGNDELIVTIG
jgi:hypothetical protein